MGPTPKELSALRVPGAERKNELIRISCSCERVAGLDGKPCVRQGPLDRSRRSLLLCAFALIGVTFLEFPLIQ